MENSFRRKSDNDSKSQEQKSTTIPTVIKNQQKKIAAKISSSVKSTWTVNRSHGNNSTLRNEKNTSNMSIKANEIPN